MFQLVEVSFLEKGIQSLWLIGIMLLARRYFNLKSIKYANMILWTILFVYLLIPYSLLVDIQSLDIHGIQVKNLIKPFILINEFSKQVSMEFGGILSGINRVFITILILGYTIYQIYKTHKGLMGSTTVEDERIRKYIKLFNFKRKITVMVNDNIRTPITYGVIKPKIIIQSHILKNERLLKFVLVHELIHIKKYDMVFTHFCNLVTCVYWYNIFILIASRYISDDMEVLCDKLVIQKLGDTRINKKEYCMSMLDLIEENEKNAKFTLKLNPTQERMMIMRKWKKSIVGVMSFVVVALMSVSVFADVKNHGTDQIVSSEKSVIGSENSGIGRVNVITDEEYNQLELGEIPLNKLRIADFDETETLTGLSNKQYSFNMKSWTEANHNGFTVKLSDMSCKSGLYYEIIIQENGNNIYRANFDKATTLTVKAQNNSRYKVIIVNRSTDTLKYSIKINSYIKR